MKAGGELGTSLVDAVVIAKKDANLASRALIDRSIAVTETPVLP